MSTQTIAELEELANNGDVSAIYQLGKKYFYGSEVEVNFDKARQYFEQAVEKGSIGANYYLGKIFYNGNGVSTDYIKAKEYFEKSSKANNVFATYYLGKLYYWGDGVPKDYNKANEYKNSILNKPLYANQNTGLEQFYSLTDFEDSTKNYVEELQEKIFLEYKSLFGEDK